MSLKPLNDRVLVKRLESEERTASGLYIPDTAKEKPSKGEVVAVGPGKHADDGKLVQAQHGGEGGGGNDADKRAGDLRAPFFGQTSMTATTSTPMRTAWRFGWKPRRA